MRNEYYSNIIYYIDKVSPCRSYFLYIQMKSLGREEKMLPSTCSVTTKKKNFLQYNVQIPFFKT